MEILERKVSPADIRWIHRNTIAQKNRRINSLEHSVAHLERKLADITERYEKLVDIAQPYLQALKLFPDKVKAFIQGLLPKQEQQQVVKKVNNRNRDNGAR